MLKELDLPFAEAPIVTFESEDVTCSVGRGVKASDTQFPHGPHEVHGH